MNHADDKRRGFVRGRTRAVRSVAAVACGVSLITTIAVSAVVAAESAPAAAPQKDRFVRLEPKQVEVRGEIGRRVSLTAAHLLDMELDEQFLRPFREKSRAEGYIGLGKTIDAYVRFAALLVDEKLVQKKDHLVAATLAAQSPDGYLGIIRPENRVWALWDIHEMSYLILGLTAEYKFFRNEKALAGAERLANYLIAAWAAEPQRKPDGPVAEHVAVTGVESAMLALYEATGNRRYLEFVAGFRRLPQWDCPIVLGRFGSIEGHAYAYLCRCTAQLRLHRVQPDPRLLDCSQAVLDFLLRGEGLTITGSCGDHECWHNTQQGTANLGETCAAAYLIRWLDERFRMEGRAVYGDLIERAMFNALFAAQSPDGRKIRYYTPFDGPRQYHKGETYCCPTNYRRIAAELPLMCCHSADDGAAVNLYSAGTYRLRLPDETPLTVIQTTDYPHSGKVRIELRPAVACRFALHLRIPSWCQNPTLKIVEHAAAPAAPAAATASDDRPVASAEKSVAQKSQQELTPGTMLRVERVWRPGDAVELDLPMNWRWIKGRVAQAGKAAVMRGPVVYGLSPSRLPAVPAAELRLIVVKPESLAAGPAEVVGPSGLPSCQVQAWRPRAWYPYAKPDLTLVLTEFADPDDEAIYFTVPNPNDPLLSDDPLFGPGR